MSLLRAELKLVDPIRLLQHYVWVLGAGLLFDGGLSLLVNWLGVPLPVNAADWRHNLLDLAWGVVLLVVSWVSRNRPPIRVAWAAVIFGAFYTALGVLGLTVNQPFGMPLGPGENAFHFVVGPLALLLGGWGLRTLSLAPGPSHTGARPAESRNGQVGRQRARRRPGKARARGRGRPSR